MSESHIRRIKKNLFNNSINEGKAHLNSFNGITITRLDHFITPILEEDRPDIVITIVGLTNKTLNTVTNIDAKSISKPYCRHRKEVFRQYLSKDSSNLRGSPGKSMTTYTTNAEVT